MRINVRVMTLGALAAGSMMFSSAIANAAACLPESGRLPAADLVSITTDQTVNDAIGAAENKQDYVGKLVGSDTTKSAAVVRTAVANGTDEFLRSVANGMANAAKSCLGFQSTDPAMRDAMVTAGNSIGQSIIDIAGADSKLATYYQAALAQVMNELPTAALGGTTGGTTSAGSIGNTGTSTGDGTPDTARVVQNGYDFPIRSSGGFQESVGGGSVASASGA